DALELWGHQESTSRVDYPTPRAGGLRRTVGGRAAVELPRERGPGCLLVEVAMPSPRALRAPTGEGESPTGEGQAAAEGAGPYTCRAHPSRPSDYSRDG